MFKKFFYLLEKLFVEEKGDLSPNSLPIYEAQIRIDSVNKEVLKEKEEIEKMIRTLLKEGHSLKSVEHKVAIKTGRMVDMESHLNHIDVYLI